MLLVKTAKKYFDLTFLQRTEHIVIENKHSASRTYSTQGLTVMELMNVAAIDNVHVCPLRYPTTFKLPPKYPLFLKSSEMLSLHKQGWYTRLLIIWMWFHGLTPNLSKYDTLTNP